MQSPLSSASSPLRRPTRLAWVLPAALAAGCASTDPGDQVSDFSVTAGPGIDRFPVNGPSNVGFDSTVGTANQYRCDGTNANTDYYTNAGDANHPSGHFGNDIFAARGTPAIAARAGRVAYVEPASSGSLGGNNVGIVDAAGWTYYYAHLDAFAPGLAAGQTVAAGTLIGYVGNTGQAAGGPVHLHFSIYPDGNYNAGIDPFPYLQPRAGEACTGGGGGLPSDPRRDDGAGRVGRTPAGALEVLVRGGDNSIWRNRRAPAGGYDGWRPMHGTAKTEPLLVPNADGHFDAVVVQPDGVVAKSWQVAPDGAWVQDGQFFAMDMAAGLRVQSRPAYALNADGRVELFALTDQGRLAHAWQLEPNGSFSPWFELGVAGTFAGAPAATRNRDGRLEVFVRGGAFLYHAWQTQPGGAWTAGGQALPVADGRALATSPAAVTNADGRLEVFVTGDDGVIRHAWQGAPGGDFSLLYPLGPRTASSSPSVLLHADGRLEVFARGAGNEVEHTWQQAPGRDWAPDLYPFANRGFTGVPAAVERTDGRLEVFGRDVEGTLFVSHQRPDLGLDDFVPVP
jgi:hypothetical protein